MTAVTSCACWSAGSSGVCEHNVLQGHKLTGCMVKPRWRLFWYLILLRVVLPAAGYAQQGGWGVTYIKEGYPVQIQRPLDRLGVPVPDKHAVLKTGIDGLAVHFGPLVSRKRTLAWFAAVWHDTLAAFSYGVPLQYRAVSRSYAVTFRLSLFYDAGEIPVELWYDPVSGAVSYTWSGGDDKDVTATVEQVTFDLLPGRRAAAFEAAWLDGSGIFTLAASGSGKVVVLNWWHPACGPCIVEIPGLNELVHRYRSRVRFVAVTDAHKDEIHAFLAKRPFAYEQARMDPATGRRVFGIGYPRHVIIAPDGLVVFSQAGGAKDRAEDLAHILAGLLGR